jgi:predicted nucleic acid-binding protein
VAPLAVFVDANVLFSAALGGPAFDLIWELARKRRIRLSTSATCRAEARANLERKRPGAAGRLAPLLRDVEIVPEPTAREIAAAERLVVQKDAPVLGAALAAAADVLVTGDVKHFGALMARGDLPLRGRTPRAFLLEGP